MDKIFFYRSKVYVSCFGFVVWFVILIDIVLDLYLLIYFIKYSKLIIVLKYVM